MHVFSKKPGPLLLPNTDIIIEHLITGFLIAYFAEGNYFSKDLAISEENQ